MSANTVVQLLLEVTLKSSALLFICWAATLIARRASAAWKHAVWAATIGASLLLFPLALFAPDWRVVPSPRPAPLIVLSAPDQAPWPVASPTAIRQETKGESTTPVRIVEQAVPPPQPIEVRRVPSWRTIGLFLWLCGVAAMLLKTTRTQLSLRALVRGSQEVEDERWLSAWRSARKQLSLGMSLTLLSSEKLDVPIVVGALHQRVIVPASAIDWKPDRRFSVLMHELAHVKRGDLFTQWIAQFGVIIFWFNPLMWFAAARVQALRERACDDLVLRYGAVPSEYAQELLSIVSGLGARENYATALAMARRSQLEGRLLAILNPTLRRKALSRAAAVGLAVTALAIVFPAAALKLKSVEHVYAAEASVTTPPEGNHERVQEAASQPPTPAGGQARSQERSNSQRSEAAAVPSDSPLLKKLAACGAEAHSSSNSNMSIIDDDGKRSWIVKWSRGDCSINLNSEGTVKFNPDFTSIVSISNGGFVDLTTRISGETQRVRFEPNSSAVRTQHWRNGSEMPMDSASQAWLRDVFIALDRQTAFAIDYRFPQLLNAGGPQRVLQEVKAMSGDYARSMYLQRLVQQVDLRAADVNGAIDATLDMQSDYEIARVLMAVAQKYSLQEASTRAAYLRALDRLKSDYEHARVLMTFFSRTQIPPELARTVLESAAKIKSDYELARVLIEMTDKKLVTKGTETDYVATIGHLNSDYEHARTLVNYLEQYGSDAQRLGPVIDQAGQIKSAYEAARVLMTIAQYRPEGAQRDAYIRVANKISSEYERKRALAAIGYKPAAL